MGNAHEYVVPKVTSGEIVLVDRTPKLLAPFQWECQFCLAVGSLDELGMTPCSHVYLNPHNRLSAIDPPRPEPPRRWRCFYCNALGFLNDLEQIACAYVYPPCSGCGQTPRCAFDCPLIGALLYHRMARRVEVFR